MWVMTTGGFVSAVQDTEDPSRVVVRARDRQSLQCVVDGAELIAGETAPEIVLGAGSDYPYRITLSKVAFAHWLAFEATEYISYDNFKSAVSKDRGRKWSEALMDVWVAMRKVTDPEASEAAARSTAEMWGSWRSRYSWEEDQIRGIGRL